MLVLLQPDLSGASGRPAHRRRAPDHVKWASSSVALAFGCDCRRPARLAARALHPAVGGHASSGSSSPRAGPGAVPPMPRRRGCSASLRAAAGELARWRPGPDEGVANGHLPVGRPVRRQPRAVRRGVVPPVRDRQPRRRRTRPYWNTTAGSAGWTFLYEFALADLLNPVHGWIPYVPVHWLGLAALGCLVLQVALGGGGVHRRARRLRAAPRERGPGHRMDVPARLPGSRHPAHRDPDRARDPGGPRVAVRVLPAARRLARLRPGRRARALLPLPGGRQAADLRAPERGELFPLTNPVHLRSRRPTTRGLRADHRQRGGRRRRSRPRDGRGYLFAGRSARSSAGATVRRSGSP